LNDPAFLSQSLDEMFKLMAMYVAFLGLGYTLLFKTIKACTIRTYLSEAAKSIQKRREAYLSHHPGTVLPWLNPLRQHGDTRLAPLISACLKEVEHWENMEDRREPLTVDMVYYQTTLCHDSTPHSQASSMCDWFITGMYGGFRLAEWAQDKNVVHRDQIKLAIDGEPTAFLISDLEFKGENGRRMMRADALQRPYLVKQITLRWRYQKNGTKNEKKTFVRITGGDTTLCAVSAWLRIIQCWVDLGLDDLHPLAVFSDNGTASGNPVLVTATHINDSLQTAAKAVYNLTDPEDIGRFTTHSIRVGACVALHAAGVEFNEIKFALRWKPDSFYNYLRNLPCQSARMAAAVLNFNPDQFTLIPIPVM
jgi:hypothetical protein